MSTQYNQLIDLGKDKKMIAAAEVGAAPLPDLLQAYQAQWLWFAVWSDSYINNADWNSAANLNTVSYLFPPKRSEKSSRLTLCRSTTATTSLLWMRSRAGVRRTKSRSTI